MSSFMVVGVDEVLNMAGAVTQKEAALAVHKILQAAAQKLEHKKIEVQIVCSSKLVKGDSLLLENRGERQPIDYIFGTPSKLEVRGFPVYVAGFNLSS